jgi:hypothetical protein
VRGAQGVDRLSAPSAARSASATLRCGWGARLAGGGAARRRHSSATTRSATTAARPASPPPGRRRELGTPVASVLWFERSDRGSAESPAEPGVGAELPSDPCRRLGFMGSDDRTKGTEEA